ncbi:hypothetical protein EU805_12895 [Salipiger sp. IMCC34102]|uniref:FliH/SctL family protein n=1 Tax=Salipiger sp. IMCC34102 TaxID=2510647 RepID=UPI00101CB158|nr:hypothetical protein [Salipiger sp. IMCC34102]RYH01556.1 hypothetical protein EU805_12895 [Salipiger sp. IMCC34102]
MTVLTRLADFAAAERPSEPVPIPTEELPGYAEGYAAGLAEAQSAQDDRIAELTRALTALCRTEEEAHREVARKLKPVFDAICSQILPRTAPQALVADLADEFARISKGVANSEIVLRCAPDDREVLAPLLPPDIALRMRLVVDPELAPLCVVLGGPGQDTIFDRGALIARISALFDAFTDHLTESETDG